MRGIAFLNDNGIIHGDLHPKNILIAHVKHVNRDGKVIVIEEIKINDFGLSKQI